MSKITALVPMRHDSERVPGKNYRPLGGRPLYHHIVASLLECPEVEEVVIDTDSELIAGEAPEVFSRVRVLERPAHLLGGQVPMNEILLHDVEQVRSDLYLQTHSTNPLLRSQTISAALREFEQASEHDSLFTVTPLRTRLWTADGEAMNHDPSVLLRTQDLPPVMVENSCLYLFDANTLRERGNRIGARPLLYPLEPWEALDIDDELDWQVVEAVFAARAATR